MICVPASRFTRVRYRSGEQAPGLYHGDGPVSGRGRPQRPVGVSGLSCRLRDDLCQAAVGDHGAHLVSTGYRVCGAVHLRAHRAADAPVNDRPVPRVRAVVRLNVDRQVVARRLTVA